MRSVLFALAAIAIEVPLAVHAQTVRRADLASLLNFEGQTKAGPPQGWGGNPIDTLFADDKTVHGGKWAARLERTASSSGQFSTITLGFPVDFKGSQVEWRGFVKTENVSGFTGLWMREDGETNAVAFDNMQNRGIKGTTEWTEYSVVLPLRAEANRIYFGVLMNGTGTTWVDDLQLLVDGKPIWEVPAVEKPKTPFDLDHEFDGGSRIRLTTLSKPQIENLALFGKVWGFLKYHHPAVASGKRQWDYDLFRELPRILSAPDHAAASAELHNWIASLGPVDDCGTRCISPNPAGIELRPDISWISDEQRRGPELSQDLQRIYKDRVANRFFVSTAPGVGNPVFDHEPAYPAIALPDSGYQLLALYRFWNIIEYWYPNRDIVGENWDEVLPEFIPRIALAADAETYKREMIALIAMVHDTHANLWGSLSSRPPVGNCRLPVVTRFVEGSAIVTAWAVNPPPADGLKIGDVITDMDGVSIDELLKRWEPYYADSNNAARLRDIGRVLTQGSCGPAEFRIRRGSDALTISATRTLTAPMSLTIGTTHDRAGDTFQKLSPDVAYLKLSSIKATDVQRYIDQASGTKGLVIDLRNYPSDFVVFSLGQLLVDQRKPFVQFTDADVSNPGTFRWGPVISLTPQEPHYSGKVVILVDEVTQSQAEYTTMALRTAAGAIVVGSTTAGADGNVSQFALPGGLRTMISGLGVFYPDKTPTQQVGIVPDVKVNATVEGIRAGRDEVLEAALRQILGARVPAGQIEKMAGVH
ncbi:MAG TPA: S41 family peptidase [Bryobacteraceae bacterium]|nr:S41 family peptidase [Bryobacteraceae bacterium]